MTGQADEGEATPKMRATSQNARKHGLAAAIPDGGPDGQRITMLARAFLGCLAQTGPAWDLALQAATAQLTLERVAQIRQQHFDTLVRHRVAVDPDEMAQSTKSEAGQEVTAPKHLVRYERRALSQRQTAIMRLSGLMLSLRPTGRPDA